MKKLLLALLLLPALSWAQTRPEPQKGDNAIFLKTTLPDSAAYTLIGRTLIQQGYTVQGNREFLSIKTDEKALPKNAIYAYTSAVAINSGKIIITGTLLSKMGARSGMFTVDGLSSPIEYRKGGMSVLPEAFAQMQAIAEKVKVALSSESLEFGKL